MVRKLILVAVLLSSAIVVVIAVPRFARHLPRPLGGVTRLSERLHRQFFSLRRGRHPTRLAGGSTTMVAQGALNQPPDELGESEWGAVDALARRLDGRIVWASNRSGHHELYVLDVQARSVQRLTSTLTANFFARFSPDGRQIVFMRSQREGVSVRDATAWDILLINVDGTGEQRIAGGGYHPTWTADGKGIIFHRAARVFLYDLATRRESMIFDAATVLPGIDDDVGDVERAPDGRRLAFVLRGKFSGAFGLRGDVSGAAVFDPEAAQLTLLTREQACQTTWAPDGRSLVWIETGGRGGTRVMTGSVDGTARRVLMDLPGAYSHEYFPKFSNDGRWLIWGAAAAGHEQDQADYEIFVWEGGTPWEQAVRLTYHPGNDNWPDLWVRPRT